MVSDPCPTCGKAVLRGVPVCRWCKAEQAAGIGRGPILLGPTERPRSRARLIVSGVILVAFLIVAILARDVALVIVMIAGFAGVVVGAIGFFVSAFRVSLHWGLVVLFVPCGGLVFLLLHDEPRKPFLLYLLGTAMLLGGAALFREVKDEVGPARREVSAPTPPVAESFHYLGRQALKAGDPEAAVAEFDKTIRINPTMEGAHFHRALAKARMGDLEGARGDYSRAIEIDRDPFEAYVNRGNVLLDMGHLELARADLDKAIQLRPGNDAAYAYRGIVRHVAGDWKGALQDLNKALELSPRGGENFVHRGRIRLEQGDGKGALNDFEWAISLNEKLATAFYHRALVRYRKEQWEESLADLSKAIELDPNLAGAYLHRGNVYRRKWDYPAALKDLEQALKVAPRDGPLRQQILDAIKDLKSSR